MKVKMKQSILYSNGDIVSIKVTDTPKSDLNDLKLLKKGPKTDVKSDKGNNSLRCLKEKGQIPLKSDISIVENCGYNQSMDSKGLTPLKCLFPIMRAGEETTTLKVAGGEEKSPICIKCDSINVELETKLRAWLL